MVQLDEDSPKGLSAPQCAQQLDNSSGPKRLETSFQQVYLQTPNTIMVLVELFHV